MSVNENNDRVVVHVAGNADKDVRVVGFDIHGHDLVTTPIILDVLKGPPGGVGEIAGDVFAVDNDRGSA